MEVLHHSKVWFPLGRRPSLWVPLAILAAVCLFAAGCGAPDPQAASPHPKMADAPGVGADAAQPRLFTVPPDQLAHLKIAPVERTAWAITVRTTGTVDWNADRTTPAITQVSGPIVRLLANPGDVVFRGQPLLYVHSPDVSNALAAYRKARNRHELTERVLAREKQLLDRGAAARKDYESAQADFNDATTDLQNSLEALKIFGISEEQLEPAQGPNADPGAQISSELAVRSPIAGVVVQKLVAPGQLIQGGSTTCYLISDVSTVWVQGHIFDRDLASVRRGDAVEETNASIPTVFHGIVDYIGAMLDPATRTTPVRIVTRNPGGVLKKDMFVDVVIHTRVKRGILAVPTSAVLRNAQNEPFVYVEEQPGRFAQRLIAVAGEQDDHAEVASGLKEGERVVSEGGLFLQFANTNQ